MKRLWVILFVIVPLIGKENPCENAKYLALKAKVQTYEIISLNDEETDDYIFYNKRCRNYKKNIAEIKKANETSERREKWKKKDEQFQKDIQDIKRRTAERKAQEKYEESLRNQQREDGIAILADWVLGVLDDSQQAQNQITKDFARLGNDTKIYFPPQYKTGIKNVNNDYLQLEDGSVWKTNMPYSSFGLTNLDEVYIKEFGGNTYIFYDSNGKE